MKKSLFQLFHERFPPDKNRIVFDVKKHKKIINNIPIEIENELKEFGFGSYGNGILCTIPPNKEILGSNNFKNKDKKRIEIIRSAFGDICFWQNGHFIWLNIYSRREFDFGENPLILFESCLIQKHFVKGVLMESLFKKALKKLGTLYINECYGFSPLPHLGGAIKPEYLIKAKIQEYLSLISQL